MNQTHPIHITVLMPREKYTSHFGLVDPARHVYYGLKKLGVDVTYALNTFREDAKNLVFGAFSNIDGLESVAHAIFNLEQLELGKGGFVDSKRYVEALRTNSVVDYVKENVSVYRDDGAEDVPIFHFLYGDHHQRGDIELENRPIDLLFIGTMNDRRLDFIDRLLGYDVNVLVPSAPVYGPERDRLIRNSKAVLNYGYFGVRFEQVRASLVMSLGTPLISERQKAPAAYEDKVFWVDDLDAESFFKNMFLSPAFFARSKSMLERFRQNDSTPYYENLVRFLMTVEPKNVAKTGLTKSP